MNRRILLRILLGILAFLVLVAGLPLVMAFTGQRMYNSQNYNTAQGLWRAASYLSFYDRDVLRFNAGNAAYQTQNYQKATEHYQAAAAIASDEHVCMITYNWGRTLADWGDQLEATKRAEALDKYADALRTIAVDRCTSSDTYRDTFEALRQYLLKKIAELSQDASQQQQQQQDQESDGEDSAQKILNDHADEQTQQRQFRNMQQYNEDTAEGTNRGTKDFVR